MPPRYTKNDIAESDAMDMKLSCHRRYFPALSGVALADLSYLLLGQFGVGDLLTLQMSTLRDFVGNVVSIRSDPEMPPSWERNAVDLVRSLVVISDAGSIVAGVVDAETFRDWLTASLYPSVPMGVFVTATNAGAALPVATRHTVAGPFPARIIRLHSDSPPSVTGRAVDAAPSLRVA